MFRIIKIVLNIKRRFVIIIIPLLLGFGCKRSLNRSHTISEKLEKYYDKEIVLPFPDSVLFQKKIIPIEQMDFKNANVHMSTYINGQCGSCINTIARWNDLLIISKNNKVFQIHIYVYTPNKENFIKYYYSHEIHSYPIILDTNKKYLKVNELSEYNDFTTFLLDSNKKVVLIGNPSSSKKLFKLYKQEINNRLDRQ